MLNNLQCTQYGRFLLTHTQFWTNCPNVNIQKSHCQKIYSVHSTVTSCWTTHTLAKSVQLPTDNNHNVTQFRVNTVRSLPADPHTLLHKVSKCQHTKITKSHNLKCTQYGHFLLTHTHSYTKCPNANIQRSQCHNLQCTQYGTLPLNKSHSCT
jgi:hypothetical protein